MLSKELGSAVLSVHFLAEESRVAFGTVLPTAMLASSLIRIHDVAFSIQDSDTFGSLSVQ